MNSHFFKLILLVSSLCFGCASNRVYPRNPLVDQVIKPRPGYERHLTNSACLKYENGNCVNLEIKPYSLDDESFRKMANEFDFICNVGGRRFKICLDKPGFCRNWTFVKCEPWDFLKIFCEDIAMEDFIPIDDYNFILESNAKCANKYKYDLWMRR